MQKSNQILTIEVCGSETISTADSIEITKILARNIPDEYVNLKSLFTSSRTNCPVNNFKLIDTDESTEFIGQNVHIENELSLSLAKVVISTGTPLDLDIFI